MSGPARAKPARYAAGVARSAVRVAIGFAIACAAVVATLVLKAHGSSTRTLLFYPAVVAATVIAGLGGGVTAAFASVLAIAYFLLPPVGLAVGREGDLLDLVIFIAMGLTVVWTLDRMIQARRRAEQATDVAKRALALRDEAVAVVAHDLKNPLQTILLSSTLLSCDNEDAMETHANRIRRSAERASRLVANLLDAAAMDAGTFHVEPRLCALGPLLADIAASFRPIAEMRGVELHAAPSPAVLISCDPDRLIQALSNLVGNAVQYTPSGGAVDLRAEPVGAGIRFVVRNSGVAMTPEQVEHAFERFWGGRKGPGGSGLGLFIAKGILEAHGGSADIASDPEGGTTATLTLPHAHPTSAREPGETGERPRPAIH